MNVIVCLDDNGGMMFNHRRQSRDRVLIKDIIDNIGKNKLYVAPYSASLFESCSNDHVCVSESFLSLAGEDDSCFVEDAEVMPYIGQIDRITVYKWNRVYPADVYFDLNPETGWTLESVEEFTGSSHEKITKEIYSK